MATVRTNTIVHKAGNPYQLTSIQKDAKNNNSKPIETESVIISPEDIPSADMVYVIPGTFDDEGTYVAPTGKAYNPVTVKGGGGAKTKTPTFSALPGHVPAGTKITISCATAGATIHYTTDGTDPDLSSPVYSGQQIPVTDAGVTIKACAVLLGLATSSIAEGFFTTAEIPDATLYYIGWLLAHDYDPVESVTAEQVLGLAGKMTGKALSADSPDPTVLVAPADFDYDADPSLTGGRIVYAYPKKFGACKYFTDGLGKHLIGDSYVASTLVMDSAEYQVYILRDVVAPDPGDEFIQRFTAN